MARNKTVLLVGLFALSIFTPNVFSQTEKKGIELNGDFRFRHEMVRRESATPSTYHQQRIRARLGAKAQPNEVTQIELRLSTAPGRTSTNQTLGATGLANFTLTLDRASFTLTAADSVRVVGGRMGNGFYLVGENDLIWDNDLNFDGLLLGVSHGLDAFTILFNVTHYWLAKNTTTNGADIYLNNLQLGFKHKLSDEMNWGFSAAFHTFNGISGQTPISASTSLGNTFSGGSYANDYRILDLGVEASVVLGPQPLSIFFDYVTNQSVSTNGTGYIAGAKYGKTKETGSYSVSYDYRQLQKDATVGDLCDGDFIGGGTNGTGHKISLAYMPLDAWTLGLTYYKGSRGIATGETSVARDKLQFDLAYKF